LVIQGTLGEVEEGLVKLIFKKIIGADELNPTG
jgi:hypothetical protein